MKTLGKFSSNGRSGGGGGTAVAISDGGDGAVEDEDGGVVAAFASVGAVAVGAGEAAAFGRRFRCRRGLIPAPTSV